MEDIDYSRYYKKWHSDEPDYIRSRVQHYKSYLLKFLPENKDAYILEVGCGMGFALLALKELGYKNSEGIDTSKQQIESAKNKGLNVHLVEPNNEFLENNEDKYDLIYSLDVLEHIKKEYQIPFVRSVYNALKKDGKFICTVPNANSILASRWLYNDWTHHCSFTEHSLDFVLYNGGFKDIEIDGNETLPRYLWVPRRGVFIWWFRLFMRKFYRLQLMAEMNPREAKEIPLAVNLLGIAKK